MIEKIMGERFLILAGVSLFSLVGWYLLNGLLGSVPSPVLKLLIRWTRLLLVGCFIGVVLFWIGMTGIPLWRLVLIGGLVWLLCESLYLWVFIFVWDRSEIPLFPELVEKETSEWPANKRFLFIKDWVREHGYREVASMDYRFDGHTLQQSVVFLSPDETIRMQVMITPDANGVLLDQVVFWSETADGKLVLTDNVFMPFGGTFPDSWKVQRFPLIRKTGQLADKHGSLVSKLETTLVGNPSSPLEWVKKRQQELEEHNRACGYLNERVNQPDYGKLTGEGRYRLWKEMMVLNYLGLSLYRIR
jgi:hypothetical protein